MDECESIQDGNTQVISSMLLCTLSNSAAARRCDLSFLERKGDHPIRFRYLDASCLGETEVSRDTRHVIALLNFNVWSNTLCALRHRLFVIP